MQALLASNMRLHESMLQLMEQAAAAAGPAAAAQPKLPPRGRQYQKATQASLGKQQQLLQPPQSLPVRDSLGQAEAEAVPASAAAHQPELEGCAPCSSRPAAMNRRVARQQPCVEVVPRDLFKAAKGLAGSRQGLLEDLSDGGPGSGRVQDSMQPVQAARTAAVDAALAISTEYKELHTYYKVGGMQGQGG